MGRPSTLALWLRPGMIGLHVLLVVAVSVCVAGGVWQYGSYEREQSDEQVARAALDPVPLATAWEPDQPFTTEQDHRRVEVTGRFAPTADQLWVSGREQDGEDGFWLLAPLVVEGQDASLLMVRGFAPAGTSLETLPPVPEGSVTVDAVLRPGQGEGGPLDDQRVTGAVRIPALLNDLARPLYSGFGIALTPTGADLPLAAPPAPEVAWTVGLTNLAYAFQWWVFALFSVFMWWRMCTDQVAQRRLALDRIEQEQDA